MIMIPDIEKILGVFTNPKSRETVRAGTLEYLELPNRNYWAPGFHSLIHVNLSSPVDLPLAKSYFYSKG